MRKEEDLVGFGQHWHSCDVVVVDGVVGVGLRWVFAIVLYAGPQVWMGLSVF